MKSFGVTEVGLFQTAVPLPAAWCWPDGGLPMDGNRWKSALKLAQLAVGFLLAGWPINPPSFLVFFFFFFRDDSFLDAKRASYILDATRVDILAAPSSQPPNITKPRLGTTTRPTQAVRQQHLPSERETNPTSRI
jgi:hypothetical protein